MKRPILFLVLMTMREDGEEEGGTVKCLTYQSPGAWNCRLLWTDLGYGEDNDSSASSLEASPPHLVVSPRPTSIVCSPSLPHKDGKIFIRSTSCLSHSWNLPGSDGFSFFRVRSGVRSDWLSLNRSGGSRPRDDGANAGVDWHHCGRGFFWEIQRGA